MLRYFFTGTNIRKIHHVFVISHANSPCHVLEKEKERQKLALHQKLSVLIRLKTLHNSPDSLDSVYAHTKTGLVIPWYTYRYWPTSMGSKGQVHSSAAKNVFCQRCGRRGALSPAFLSVSEISEIQNSIWYFSSQNMNRMQKISYGNSLQLENLRLRLRFTESSRKVYEKRK